MAHHVTERRPISEQAWVENDIGVGGERLVRRKAVGCTQVHRLRADEDHRVQLLRQGTERVEQHSPGLDVLDAGLLVHLVRLSASCCASGIHFCASTSAEPHPRLAFERDL